MDTIFELLININNKFEKVSKHIKFRYLYPLEVKNHYIYAQKYSAN